MILEAIKEAMKIRGVKAKDLAEAIGVTKGSMSLFLSGKMKLGQDKLDAVLIYLNIEFIVKLVSDIKKPEDEFKS